MSKTESATRRDFLRLAGASAPAAVAAIAAPAAVKAAAAEEASAEGLRTEHVEKYLETARF